MNTLISAYLATAYVVFDGEDEIALRIGETNDRMARLMASHGVRSAVVLTAWNPRSVPATDEENAAWQRELEAAVAGHPVACAEGRGEIGDWPPEASVCVFGLSATQACRLADRFGQTAFVLVDDSGLSWLVTRPPG